MAMLTSLLAAGLAAAVVSLCPIPMPPRQPPFPIPTPPPLSPPRLLRLTDTQPLANQSYPYSTPPGEEPYNPKEPLQQRLAYVNSTAMAISWNTYTPLEDAEAIIHYGSDPLNLDKNVGSQQTTFETSRTWSHHAVLTGLEPNTEYHYRVAHTNCFACATLPTYTFTTAREAGDCEGYTVAIVADMGLMGPNGLTNVTGEGAEGALEDDETNTIQSLVQNLDAYEHISTSSSLLPRPPPPHPWFGWDG